MKKIVLYFIVCNLTATINAHTATMNIHNHMMANYLQFGGKSKQAYELYKSMLGSQAPVYAYKGYIHLLFDTANFPHIVQLIPQLDPVFEHDPAVQLIFAQALEKHGKLNEADERYIKLNDNFKHNQEIAFSAANSYLRRKEPENALHVIDTLLNSSPRKPNNFIFHFMKAQIYIQLNKKSEALKSVQKSLDIQPRFDKAWLLLALLHEQEGELNDAIKGYTNFLEVTGGNNREVEQHLLQLIFKQKIKNNAMQGVSVNKQCLDNALFFFEKKQYQKALDSIDGCIKQNPKNTQNKLFKIEILSAMNLENQAAQTLKDWITQEPKNTLWYKVLHLMTQTNLSQSQAVQVLHDVEKAHPKELLPALYLADLHTRMQHNKEALIYHQKALSLTQNAKLQEKILFQMGFMHYQAQQFKQFQTIIAQAQKRDISYAPLLNLIAYYYTMQENKLDQAQALISNALKNNSNNPHFLDTQAMIYLKQNNTPKALGLLEKIAQMAPSDYTVLIHLAQARRQAGKTAQAIEALEIAQRYAKTPKDRLESKVLLSQWKTKKQSNIIASAL